ncbi:hypothetical protein EON63_19120 [archaeon]|nr:MAG: hypothetical protein EON63_19120 [archaeon]
MMQHVGGKMSVFTSTLPGGTPENGGLKHRENPRLLGTDKEHTLFQPDEVSCIWCIVWNTW